jgi:hypothetical protein
MAVSKSKLTHNIAKRLDCAGFSGALARMKAVK